VGLLPKWIFLLNNGSRKLHPSALRNCPSDPVEFLFEKFPRQKSLESLTRFLRAEFLGSVLRKPCDYQILDPPKKKGDISDLMSPFFIVRSAWYTHLGVQVSCRPGKGNC